MGAATGRGHGHRDVLLGRHKRRRLPRRPRFRAIPLRPRGLLRMREADLNAYILNHAERERHSPP